MLEKEIEKKVCTYAKKIGCKVYKFVSPGQRSVPDRMFIAPNGRVFFIEFKAPGKEPTPAQLHEMTEMRKNKAIVFWTDSVEEGNNFVAGEVTMPQYREGWF